MEYDSAKDERNTVTWMNFEIIKPEKKQETE